MPSWRCSATSATATGDANRSAPRYTWASAARAAVALAFGVHVLAAPAGLTVARPAAFLQAALWGVVVGLVV
jgi:hypothetical protein